jgi:hypothetical protein
MSEKEIKVEILEAKVYPCCEQCEFKHIVAVDTKKFFKKTYTISCSAQGYQATAIVYGTENCIGNYTNQLKLPMLTTADIKIIKTNKGVE